MRHLIPLIVKYFLIALGLALILPLFGRNSVTAIFYMAAPITVIIYTLGDLTVLPRAGNAAASLLSVIITGMLLLAGAFLLPELAFTWSGTIAGSLVIGISDWYYHRWLIRNGIIDSMEA